jgi:WD40 repeat protein
MRESITFHTHNYTFVGTQDGRILQYTHDKKHLLARLFSFGYIHTSSKSVAKKNIIQALTVYENIIAAGQGAEIVYMDIYTRCNKTYILKSKATITALRFIDTNKLISANVDGEVFIHNLKNKKTKKLVTTLQNISSLLYLEENNTLIVGASLNYIALIDLTSEIIITNKLYKYSSPLKSICFDTHNNLLVNFSALEQKTHRYSSLVQRTNTLIQKSLHRKSVGVDTTTHPPLKLNATGEKLLLEAYECNNFTLCYELIDRYKLYPLNLSDMLEKHWKKIVKEAEKYALNGDAKSILSTMQELLFVTTRSYKIGDLLRLSFLRKLTMLIEEKQYNSAHNIIYSYIDIFGYDLEITSLIENYETQASQKIAIFNHQDDRISRLKWRDYFLKQ